MSNNNNEYDSLSKTLTKTIPKTIKKTMGIFFTPPTTIHKNINMIKDHFKNIKNILEPSCGSCEYIKALNKLYPSISITGIEYNDTIYESIKHLSNEQINIIHDDYLSYSPNTKYDLIIGNPPYFVMKKAAVDKAYYEYYDGRPNIFILFIIKSLNLLAENGILSFVLPKNFMNCLYYDKTRKHIAQYFNILNILECNDKYLETQQETIILIIQKNTNNTNAHFIKNINNYTIFSTPKSILKMNELYKNSTSLHDLGFKVNVGNVVWNQCKDILTDNKQETRLIYSSDIVNNELSIKKYKNEKKKNFIEKPGNNTPLLVVNRGYGKGTYKFNYCLIKGGGINYLVENHLICIKYTKPINNDKLIKLYQNIIKSLHDRRTKEFIKLYFGNNAINTTELEYILPIYHEI